ncbi:hypothetical protein CF326_g5408 [Tilletia indica]|nr:hypothetical protein CF326_g5408 [Tilletia indica]
MNDDSDSSTPVMNSTEPKMFDRALHEHSRYAVMRKVARMLAPTRIPLTDDEDEEDDLESISGASDSESDDSEVAPEDGWVISKGEAPDGWVISEAETWNTADKMTADLDKACRSYSRHFSTTAENPDLYQHNRDLMLSKLAKFPDTPK